MTYDGSTPAGAADTPTDSQLLLEQARRAAEAGEYAQAATLFQRGVGNPEPLVHVASLLGLADARYRLDDEYGALAAWLAATQAPETPLAWQAWVQLAGARVREGDLVGATRAYREAEARAPADERAPIQSRLGWLNKEMGNTGSARRYFGRARPGAFQPLVTYALIFITASISLTQELPLNGQQQLVDLLELNKEAVLHGEYWRLITITLVHGGLFHLLMNMYALWIVGPLAEALYGRVTFLAIYLLSAVGGSLASYLVFPGISVGASGAIFGLFGLIFVSTYVHKPLMRSQARALTSQIGLLIVLNLVIGFGIASFAPIDNAGHIGGLLVGAALGFLIPPRGATTLSQLWRRPPRDTDQPTSRNVPLLRMLGLAALGAVLVIGVMIKPLWA
jgi:membrane associated rhomboid family serine protease